MKRLSLLAAGLAVPLLVLAATLNVKPGQWEVTMLTEMQGMPQLPPEVLSKMTPEQRAQIEEAFSTRNGKGPKEQKTTQCITKEDLEKPFGMENREGCKSTVVKSSPTTQELTLVCTGEHPAKGRILVNTPTPDSMNGNVEIVMENGGSPLTVKSKVSGRWISATCKEED